MLSTILRPSAACLSVILFAFVLGFPAFAADTNLIANPQLEGAGEKQLPPHWAPLNVGPEARFSIDTNVTRSGKQSARIDASEISRSYLLSDPIPIAPGEEIAASAWVKAENVPPDKGTVIVIAAFAREDGRGESVQKVGEAKIRPDGTTDWQHIRGKVKAPANATRMRLRLGFSYSQGTTWWDDVAVHAVQPVVARLELPSQRISPAMQSIPVSILNRAQQRGAAQLRLTLGKQSAQADVRLSGEPMQRVEVPIRIDQRGQVPLTLALHRANGAGEAIFTDERKITIPPPMVLSPPIPTHWAIEDGPATVEGEVDLAVEDALRNGAKLTVQILDAAGRAHAGWSPDGPIPDGMTPFSLQAPKLPEGQYKLVAELRPRSGKPIREEQDWAIIPRRLAKVTLNDAGFPVYDGKVILPMGIFNGGGRMKEAGEAGFTISHAYNSVEAGEGGPAGDARALEFMNSTHAAGMKALMLIPRPPLFHGDWDTVRRRIRMFRNHPALLAWDSEEGIARGDMKPETLEKLYALLKEEDPHHPLMVGDSRDAINRVTDRSNFFPLAAMDMGMWWWYPIPPGGAKADALQGEELTTAMELAPPSFLTLRNTDKPIWVGVQSYRKPQPWARYPNPTEYRAQAYIAMIHGAQGLMWYGGSVTGGLFLKPDEGNWDYLKQLAGELRGMQEVLLAPDAEAPSYEPADAPISLRLKRLPDRLVLLAVNRGSQSVEVTFASPQLTSREAQVLTEKRTVRINSNQIKDHFEPYQTHLYELRQR